MGWKRGFFAVLVLCILGCSFDVLASPPKYLTRESFNFINIRPTDFIITREGRFEGIFETYINGSIRVTGVNVTNQNDYAVCKIINTTLPTTVNVYPDRFILKAEGCIPTNQVLKDYSTDLSVDLTYDVLSANGSTLKNNVTEKGILRGPYEPLPNSNEGFDRLSIAVIVLVILLLGLLKIFRNKPTIKNIIELVLYLVLGLIALFILTNILFPSNY